MSDAAVVLIFMSLLYLTFAVATAWLVFTETVMRNSLDELERKITLARAVVVSVIWPVFWAAVAVFLLVRGTRFVLRYAFKPLHAETDMLIGWSKYREGKDKK